jgi:hypothetical protein
MEVPGLGSVNNPIRLDPNRVTTPEVTPGRVTPEKAPAQAPVQQPTLPHQAPKTPVLTQNQQAFSSLLMEMGIPNTMQNNQLAQVLANYGQPINRQTITQVTLALGPLVNTGPANMEAAVVLMINNIPISKQSLDAVRTLLNSGGLTQNLIGFSKDLQKLVDNFSNKKIGEMLPSPKERSKELARIEQPSGRTAEINRESTENVKPDVNTLQAKEGKVEEAGAVMKNPYQEEEGEEKTGGNKGGENTRGSIPTEKALVKAENPEIKINTVNNPAIADELSLHAQKINKSIMNLLTLDILKNPDRFPMQIAMLRKSFSDLEIDIKEFREIIRKNFPGILDEEEGEENIFTDLLKLVFNEEEPEKLKKLKGAKPLKEPADFAANLLKDIARTAEAINLSMAGREILTKALDCMCLPMSVPFNGQIYQVEVMIRREDQSNKKTEVGHVPLRIQLAVETMTMGKVVININNLKKDLQVNLAVETKFIQKKVQAYMEQLQDNLKTLPFDLAPIQCVVNPRPDENPSILLPRKYKVMSMRRIEGIV